MRHLGGALAEPREESGRGEVPDLVVGDAEVEDDLVDPLAALERELDLDRGLRVAVQDRVGEVVAVARARAGLLCECAFALPAAEPELVFEQQADVGDGLEVADEAVVGLPGAEAAARDRAAAAGQPDERRQLDRELRGAGPAGVDPAVAQAAGGSIAAPDEDRELVECERVLLSDVGEQLAVSAGDLVAALVSACSPLALLPVSRDRFIFQCRSLLPSLPFADPRVLPLPPRIPWGVAAVVRDHPRPPDALPCLKVGGGGHARGAAGEANGSDAQPRINTREREHTPFSGNRRTAGQPEPGDCPAARRTNPSQR